MVLPGTIWFFQVLPGTELSPLFVSTWRTKQRCSEVPFFLKSVGIQCLHWNHHGEERRRFFGFVWTEILLSRSIGEVGTQWIRKNLFSYKVIHCSKNLRERIHCGKLLLKRTFLVLTLRYKIIKIYEWEATLWLKSSQKCVEQLFKPIWRLFSIKKCPATEGDP